jgi:hypothetical protein
MGFLGHFKTKFLANISPMSSEKDCKIVATKTAK